ncbi:hypothetical protein FF098_012820 [Parvularcula flava]|uniref:Sugar transporter n=1 Tax=Aquisalinus luteolus TaxID=1566827 RepID=A0A8J3ERI5_9PROT|nr:hypothetical protein [Aquisalinus luteolus]NHK28796.1 hypothetical protein [Aquisalinus luteolus]GGH99543.1 hypothetical protein GCM10011355_25750 [Aquisalinus luteolus]
MSETKKKTPVWFWIVAVVALLWNLLGVLAYIGTAFMMGNEQVLSTMEPEMRELYENIPAWSTAAFAIATFAGLFGAILLLMKNGLARILFIISLIAVLVQDYYSFAVAKMHEITGPTAFIMPVIVILVSLFLIWLSGKAAKDFR